jgi:hypothetical protein
MEQKEKKKYYQIYIWLIPEVDEKLDDISNYYMKEYLKKLLNKDIESFLSISQSEIKEFFGNGYIYKRIYADKELYEKWRLLPKVVKKRLYYLVNNKLLEVLKDEPKKRTTKD